VPVRCGKVIVVAALIFATGLHWAGLQTVAWTAMLAINLRSHSVTEAVTQTFDGRHPCSLCKAIAAGKKSEKKPEAVSLHLKLDFPPAAEKVTLIAPKWSSAPSRVDLYADSFLQKPPLPPPRSLLV